MPINNIHTLFPEYLLTLHNLTKNGPKCPQMTSNQKVIEQRPQLKFNYTYLEARLKRFTHIPRAGMLSTRSYLDIVRVILLYSWLALDRTRNHKMYQ